MAECPIALLKEGGKSGQRRAPHHLTDGISTSAEYRKCNRKQTSLTCQGKGENGR